MQTFQQNNPAFKARVNTWRALLARTPGQNFALYINNSAEFTSALLGSWLAGKTIYLPSNILPDTCTALQKNIDGFLGEFPSHYSPLNPTKSDEHISFDKTLIQDYECLIIYTSGSTGSPQAVSKKLSQLSREIETLETLFGNRIPKEAEIISTVSHEHLYGLLFKILWPLTTGRVIHTQNILFLDELETLPPSHARVLISSPAHLKRAKSFAKIDTVFSSAGPLLYETAQIIKQHSGKAPIEIYGSTETGGIAWRQRNETNDEHWQPLPNITWRIASENNRLEICSPHLANSAWFCTADQASTTDNTYFLLHGRADRIVKLEGKRISLNTIESQLLLSPWVSEVRTLMSDENHQRNYIFAYIVLSDEGKKVLAEIGKVNLNKHLRATLENSVEKIAHPRVWRYLDALPVNAQGKTTRVELMRPIFPHQRLIEKDDHHAVFELLIPSNLLYFEGHFSSIPVLPGVVQVHWAITYGRDCFNLPLSFKQLSKLKFQRIIQPNMTVILDLFHHSEKKQLDFSLRSEAGQHASGSIHFD